MSNAALPSFLTLEDFFETSIYSEKICFFILLSNVKVKVGFKTLSIDEMEKRVNKKWNDTKDDIALQKRFKYLWPFDKMYAYEYKSNQNFKKSNEIPLISSCFLRKYKFLLN